MVITSIASGITVGVILTNNYKDNLGISYEALQSDEKLNEFIELYASIINDYYEDINTEEMIDSAVDGMLKYLDESYTTYLNKAETEDLEERLSGYYKGIGIAIQDKVIISITENTPAASSGLQVNDLIVAINNIDVSEKTNGEITQMIKKSDEDSVLITVARGEKKLSFDVEITSVPLASISYEMLENNIGYISLFTFDEGCSDEFEANMDELINQGATKIIFDLRYNTGGIVDEALDIIDLFVDKGDTTLIEMDGKGNETVITSEKDKKYDVELVILTNEYTASSSEIVTGALVDNEVATTVGTTTYGKGVIQNVYSLSDGSVLKLTTTEYYTPNRNKINKVGIKPDYEVQLDENNVTEDGTIFDNQLEKAKEILK